MRFRSVIVIASVVAGLVAAVVGDAAQSSAPVMASGLWEITVQTQSPAVGPPITHRLCVNRALLTRPDPPTSKPSDDCQVQPGTSAANETAYTVRCAKSKLTSSWQFTYSGDHFEGTATITSSKDEIRQTITAKRIGACDEAVADQPATTTAQ